MKVLGQDPGRVLHRHFIAGEGDQPRAALDMKLTEWRAQQRDRLVRFAHTHLRWLAEGAGRKRMRGKSGRIGAPHGDAYVALSVPPLWLCLRTLSRRRAQR